AKFMKRKYRTERALATIEEELAYTNYYLDIQKLRLASRLQIDMDIDEQLSEALMPSYVIQTLTENCFKHSFEIYPGSAFLKISLVLADDTIILTVWNNKMVNDREYMVPS